MIFRNKHPEKRAPLTNLPGLKPTRSSSLLITCRILLLGDSGISEKGLISGPVSMSEDYPMRSQDTLLRLHRFRAGEKRRQATELDHMIQDFGRKFNDLDAQVKIEEGRNGVSDPAHFNYSLSAKAARARRDMVMKSIGELKDQLADALIALNEEETELRRVELMAEKDSLNASAAPGTGRQPAAAYVR